MEKFNKNQENQTSENDVKVIFHYCDKEGKPIFKTKEIFKKEKKIILYPYGVTGDDSEMIVTKKIKTIELRGWNDINSIPKDIKTTQKYGLGSQRIKLFFQSVYPKFKELEKIVIGINISNRFYDKTISINWADLEKVLKVIANEKRWYDGNRKLFINNSLSQLTTKIQRQDVLLSAGQLDSFLKKFDSFEKVTKADVESLSKVMETAPPSKISLTSNFIKTRDKINKVFIEDIIAKFEHLMSSKIDNEKQWQKYFGENSWIFNHLFKF
jgi:hypothetical protein